MRSDVARGMATGENAEFWASVNVGRWSQAVAVEAATDTAVCDTDPLKLHYDYCLARVGVGSWAGFRAGVRSCRSEIAHQSLGPADAVVCCIPDDASLADRQRADPTRGRRNFDLHRGLSGPLRDWYAALNDVDPGRVTWGFPDELPVGSVGNRYDLGLFDAWMRVLPSPNSQSWLEA